MIEITSRCEIIWSAHKPDVAVLLTPDSKECKFEFDGSLTFTHVSVLFHKLNKGYLISCWL